MEHWTELLNWAVSHGLDASTKDKLVLHEFLETGRGVKCVCAIDQNSLIISIPLKLIITPDMGWSSALTPSGKRFTGVQSLCVLLLQERNNANSFWAPYLKTLPKIYSTPAYWKKEELNHLPVWIKEKALQHIEKLRSDYKSVQRHCPGVFQSGFSFPDFTWAWTTVNTRAVYMHLGSSIEDCIILAPVLDMLNHSAHIQVQAGFSNEEMCYQIVTSNSYGVGEQVFISYGPHDNVKLAIEYGFIVPGNPHATVPFDEGDILDFCKLLSRDDKYLFLKTANYLQSLCLGNDCLSWNFEVTLQILAVASSDRSVWQDIATGHLHLSNGQAFKDTLNSLLRYKLDKIPTLFYKIKRSPHRELIMSLCAEQIDILNRWISVVT